MPGIGNRFRSFLGRAPAVAVPTNNGKTRGNALLNIGKNSQLENGVKKFVNSYIRNRNSPNKVATINKELMNNVHKYVNYKRPRIAGAVSATAANANASLAVQEAAAEAVAATPPSAPPSVAGTNVQQAVLGAGGNNNQAMRTGAAAAANQAAQQGKTPNQIAVAAARAANQAAPPTAPPANIAGAAGNAAGNAVPLANKANANRLARLHSLLNTYNGKNNMWYNNKNNLNSLVKNLNNASRNVNLNNNARARLNIVRKRIANAKARKAPNASQTPPKPEPNYKGLFSRTIAK